MYEKFCWSCWILYEFQAYRCYRPVLANEVHPACCQSEQPARGKNPRPRSRDTERLTCVWGSPCHWIGHFERLRRIETETVRNERRLEPFSENSIKGDIGLAWNGNSEESIVTRRKCIIFARKVTGLFENNDTDGNRREVTSCQHWRSSMSLKNGIIKREMPKHQDWKSTINVPEHENDTEARTSGLVTVAHVRPTSRLRKQFFKWRSSIQNWVGWVMWWYKKGIDASSEQIWMQTKRKLTKKTLGEGICRPLR